MHMQNGNTMRFKQLIIDKAYVIRLFVNILYKL